MPVTPLVVLAAAGPLQWVALIVVAVAGLTLAFTARVLTRRVTRGDRDDVRPTQPDDLEPGEH
ncbi:hypothetical protein ACLBWP_13300 [Microbacterium sp. M1A1_1b]|uniref:hypothetical protein n=1 Tax=Curtobacterium sp. VKM Ac-2922 TaxID=2929475 RepID=UPI001FB2E3A7|nr:hypothetical protein [Curtobacterium sp. VKM Ac-2922]MCJ1713290.1 hypothetical protein [Curtobacterium sp. VKM Ac-2922]